MYMFSYLVIFWSFKSQCFEKGFKRKSFFSDRLRLNYTVSWKRANKHFLFAYLKLSKFHRTLFWLHSREPCGYSISKLQILYVLFGCTYQFSVWWVKRGMGRRTTLRLIEWGRNTFSHWIGGHMVTFVLSLVMETMTIYIAPGIRVSYKDTVWELS